ncbi:helix-turn-helix domain-containing protein [Brenneria tiliae]|uniref:Arabinose operon regulatory protein n=1 Tax=Brenneria tiliae TaxID=2914984 RepID=A0ABT0MVY5_9GAMM|nr:helix-turn-helix domain-containing protein [Brenneria tiliae]MCL2893999.1 helix-turn-helix domain-containing protein [Brenneria tiliae]MCL2896497.1 helix-turn-helix domain-containing protein [Brenneria tiliae]MCL2900974.1 helix-turn-helix domain-containing protein [Brenneria tiliae]
MTTTIPTYALYGEKSELSWENFFNVEEISYRSKTYNWKVSPHLHESLIQVLFIQQGEVDVLLNYARLMAVAPCLILVPAQTVHSFHYTPDTEGLTITASQKPLESMAGLLAPSLITLIHKPCVIPLAHSTRDRREVRGFYQLMKRELRMPRMNQTAMCMSLFASLFVHIARISKFSQQQEELATCSRKAAQINKFLLSVDRQFRKRLSVNDYAGQMGISPGHLSRLCRATLGMSSLDVINMRVIQEAQRELVYTAQTIKQLAASLGFNDEAYFTRFFHKHTGVSPKQFRELAVRQIALSEERPPTDRLTG